MRPQDFSSEICAAPLSSRRCKHGASPEDHPWHRPLLSGGTSEVLIKELEQATFVFGTSEPMKALMSSPVHHPQVFWVTCRLEQRFGLFERGMPIFRAGNQENGGSHAADPIDRVQLEWVKTKPGLYLPQEQLRKNGSQDGA